MSELYHITSCARTIYTQQQTQIGSKLSRALQDAVPCTPRNILNSLAIRDSLRCLDRSRVMGHSVMNLLV